ncbi:MAG: Uma2 family endonuclease [Alphaproteobacteria bacterium]|nr:Uma2 family endonuclease [Alphaproteobacteria bacterium]
MLAPRRFTADEVLRMVEVGVLHEDEPVELIDGQLLVRAPCCPRRRALTVKIRQCLERALGDGVHAQARSPVAAGPYSMPEPDVAVVRGSPDGFMDRHPGADDLIVVVEISVTTVATDTLKAGVYAAAGIPTYWQVDVPAGRVRVHTEPVEGEYRSVRVGAAGDVLELEGARVAVAELLG